jgi:hypothetical protein
MILLCLVLATSHGTEPPSSSYRSVIHDANVDITPVLIDEFQSDSSLRFAVCVAKCVWVGRLLVCDAERCGSHSCQLLGDWGGMERRGADARFPFTTQSQLVVAEALSQTVRRRGVQFVVSLVRCGKCDFVCELVSFIRRPTHAREQYFFIFGSQGDHFYQKGVRSVNDSRFHDTFEHVYSQPNLMQLPWYMIAGNHGRFYSAMLEFRGRALSKRARCFASVRRRSRRQRRGADRLQSTVDALALSERVVHATLHVWWCWRRRRRCRRRACERADCLHGRLDLPRAVHECAVCARRQALR